jgi:3-phosphoglycerate kinase
MSFSPYYYRHGVSTLGGIINSCDQGEEDKGEYMERFVVQLAGLADVYVNDAFGSWQSHASTYHITKFLPSYAGLCLQVHAHAGSHFL